MRFAGNTASASQPFINGRNKYGGLDFQQLTKMKEMERNFRSKEKVVAELTRENVVMKDMFAKSFNTFREAGTDCLSRITAPSKHSECL